MSERFDRYNLAARLETLGDRLAMACERGEAIENRVDVCNQLGALCRIVMTLRALRAEAGAAKRLTPESRAARCDDIPARSQPSRAERSAPEAPPRPQSTPLTIPAGPILTTSELVTSAIVERQPTQFTDRAKRLLP